ncbi:beta-glucosyl-HMC-alpha-glucosyltransferase [Vibrio phage VB_VaC_SRILMA]
MFTDDVKERIHRMKEAVIRVPDNKIPHFMDGQEERRMSDFCVFILTYGRPDKIKTYKRLFREGGQFNQDYYFICSDDDKQLDEYIRQFGDRVLVFNKKKMIPHMDKGDNFDKYGVILYARNIAFTFANLLGYRYFVEFDDDYDEFRQRMLDYDGGKLKSLQTIDLDRMFRVHLDFLKNTPCKTITMSQMGDYIGGMGNANVLRGYQRKVMNSFFCDIEEPFLFDGTINEDVNYYVQSGRIGILNFNLFGFALNQGTTQQTSGGMTEQYLDGGTYLKSFYSVMYAPSCVKVGTISHGDYERMHHRVNSELAYAKIIDEKYKHNTYLELQPTDDW